MERCYTFVRRAVVVVSSVVVVASAATAAAQYMYLDANGDGVHTSADVVPPSSGTVTFDVWLVTDRDRAGTAAVCAQGGNAPKLRGYAFVLQATNATVTWSDVRNLVPGLEEAATPLPTSTELSFAATGPDLLPAGAYKVAAVAAAALLGTPNISILDWSSNGLASTYFESDCPGSGHDYTLRLGIDWFGTDGLPYGGTQNHAPAIDPIQDMVVSEGTVSEQTLSARDEDGNPLTFMKGGGPPYMTVLTVDPASGLAAGRVHLEPGFLDAGSQTGMVRATDGVLIDERSFAVTVQNVNRPFTWTGPADVEVEAGGVAEQEIFASDPDGGLSFVVSGPDYVSIATSGSHPVVRFEPPLTSGGVELVTLTVTDGEFTETKSFYVTVVHSHYPPSLQKGSAMTVVEGGYAEQLLRVIDPDGDRITFTLAQGPPYATLTVLGSTPGESHARLELRPRIGDAGSSATVVQATDGSFLETTTVPIRVLPPFPGDTRLLLQGEAGEYMTGGSTVYVGTSDASFRAARAGGSGVVVEVVIQPANKEPSPDVLLAPSPSIRADCISPVAGLWSVQFYPPTGRELSAGTYRVSGQAGGDSTAGILIAQSCPNGSPSDGTLDVRQFITDGFGAVVSFWASFDVTCGKKLHGEVRYNAMPPAFVTAPARRTVFAGGTVSFDVVGSTAPELGPVHLAGTNLPPGATLTASGPSRSTLVWSPGFEQIGLYALGFLGTSAAGDTGSTFTLLTVSAKNAASATMDVNRLVLTTTNDGALIDGSSWNPGALHPLSSGFPIAASAALWVAGRISGDVRTALGGCESHFVPGPLIGGAPAPFDPRFKNYAVDRGVSYGTDLANWPADQGAPIDSTGGPLVLGNRSIWSVYNAADPATNPPPSGHNPLALEVRQLTWASPTPTPLGDVVFMRFGIQNGGSERLEDAYVGLSVQPTTFDHAGHVGVTARDVAGCDTTLGLGYGYSSWPYWYPNAFGVVLLSGPLEGGARHGMTSFTVPGYTETPSPTPEYDLLRGLKRDGSPWHEFDDPSRPVTHFAYTGDPFRGSGWLASPVPYGASDFVLSSGPFALDPGETQEVEIAWIASISFDRLDAVARLKDVARALRQSVPATPENHAPLLAVPDTAKVAIGDPLQLQLAAVDSDADRIFFSAYSLPAGAVVVPEGDDRARIEWTPSGNQAGSWRMTVVATDSRGGSARKLLTLVAGSSSPDVFPALSARAFLPTPSSILRIDGGKPLLWIALEPVGGSYDNAEIDLASIRLALAENLSAEAQPAAGERIGEGDVDRNGVDELRIPFSRSDLLPLLGELRPGRNVVRMRITARTRALGSATAEIEIPIDGGHGIHAVRLSPNPLNPDATFRFRTTRGGSVRLLLFDSGGRLVRTLIEEPSVSSGHHEVRFDGRSSGGARLASGVYFYRLESIEGSTSGRFTMLK